MSIETELIPRSDFSTYFIEKNYGEDAWVRYAGAFDSKDRAVRYLETLCGWVNHRVVRYDRVEVVQEKRA